MPHPQKTGEISAKDKAAYESFIDDFANESDRAAVILGAAKLDLQLYQILQKVLLPNPSSLDELLDGDSPLSTFSSRINMCYRLGLIDRALTRALHLVRKIRNSFAHEISGSDLSSGAHRDRIKELAAPFAEFAAFTSLITTNQTKWKMDEGPRLTFRAALAVVGARLEGLFYYAPNCHHEAPCPLVPPQWRKKEAQPTAPPQSE